MNTAVKKVLNIALKVVTWLLIAFTVFMMIFTVVTVTTVDKNDRGIFGFKFYIVQTDSMSLSEKNKDMDVHFNAGDIVIIKNVPSLVCEQCGEVSYSDEVAQELEKIINKIKQKWKEIFSNSILFLFKSFINIKQYNSFQ